MDIVYTYIHIYIMLILNSLFPKINLTWNSNNIKQMRSYVVEGTSYASRKWEGHGWACDLPQAFPL